MNAPYYNIQCFKEFQLQQKIKKNFKLMYFSNFNWVILYCIKLWKTKISFIRMNQKNGVKGKWKYKRIIWNKLVEFFAEMSHEILSLKCHNFGGCMTADNLCAILFRNLLFWILSHLCLLNYWIFVFLSKQCENLIIIWIMLGKIAIN